MNVVLVENCDNYLKLEKKKLFYMNIEFAIFDLDNKSINLALIKRNTSIYVI